MRWIGLVLGLCLLFAGAPKRALHDHQRPQGADEITAAKALAKLAARRQNDTRLPNAVGLDPIALASATARRPPPQTCVLLVHASPVPQWVRAHDSFDARGPPIV